MQVYLMGKNGKMGKILNELIDQDPELQLTQKNADLVIDFSSAEGTKKAIAMGKPLVCGTTGLSKEIFDQLTTLSKHVPVLYSPNFSLGMALCFEILEQMGKKLKKFSSVSIKETHHTGKKDTPSGTSLKMAQLLDIESKSIESHRIDDVVGTHQVNFIFEEEQIQLTHEAFSRKAFALGALAAAKFIFQKPAKLYTLADFFC